MIVIFCGISGLIASLFVTPFGMFLGYLGTWAYIARLKRIIAPDAHKFINTPPGTNIPTTPNQVSHAHLTVIVPAHNEHLSIQRTVESIARCNWPSSMLRILVIADNCTDNTAAIARAAGADVYIRTNNEKRSKGYALEEVIAELTNAGSSWYKQTSGFIIIDADASPNENFFHAVSAALLSGSDFGQCANLVRNPSASWRTELMSVAFALFNGTYLIGLKAGGHSGHLRGNGIFMSFGGAKRHPWRASSLAEDLEFSWKLKLAGEKIDFLQSAVVLSDMPNQGSTSKSQRARWEHGRKALKRAMTKPIIKSKITVAGKLLMLLELWLPALSTMVSLSVLGFVLLAIAIMFDPEWQRWKPFHLLAMINLCALTIYGLSPFLCGIVPFRSLLALRYAPFYAVWRIVTIATNKPVSWIRTSRDSNKTDAKQIQKSRSEQTATLINLGDYYGSIAAARCLGKHGLQVFFGDHRKFVPGKWSRYTTHRVSSPDMWNQSWNETMNWLRNFGKQHPGTFLYPTCDDLCFLISKHREELEENFLLYQPSVETVMTLLDKKKLASAAAECQIQTPITFAPNSESELRSLSSEISFRTLVKPRTQVGLTTRGKGQICDNPSDLVDSVRQFLTTERYRDEILEFDPTIAWPMIQKFHSTAIDGMISIAGFVSHDSDDVIAFSSKKVFQRPRRLGVGIAFEGTLPDRSLVTSLAKLCKAVGYFGIFEAEFVTDEQTGSALLVDFNPRYYGQMAFEIGRGLRLPILAFEAAQRMQHLDSLKAPQTEFILAKSASQNQTMQTAKYALGWTLKLMILTQFLGGRLNVREATFWRNWLQNTSPKPLDAIYNKNDCVPWLIELLSHWSRMIVHPRDSFKKLFLG